MPAFFCALDQAFFAPRGPPLATRPSKAHTLFYSGGTDETQNPGSRRPCHSAHRNHGADADKSADSNSNSHNRHDEAGYDEEGFDDGASADNPHDGAYH